MPRKKKSKLVRSKKNKPRNTMPKVVLGVLIIIIFSILVAIFLGNNLYLKISKSNRDIQRKALLERILYAAEQDDPQDVYFDGVYYVVSLPGEDIKVAITNNYLKLSPRTDSNSTAICFSKNTENFNLGVMYEDGSWYFAEGDSCDEASALSIINR
ncbi:MAG TPA: hypothetical protein VGA67_05200 [Candidatus Dojkabacteria bacterium]|jgi:hypothetical protein